MRQHALLAHPCSTGVESFACDARVQLCSPDTLALQYVLSGDLRRIRIPVHTAAERADGLWRHTCFEAFVRPNRTMEYLELNFAPSGRWQAYRFGAYRKDGAPAPLPAPPSITVGHRERAAAAEGGGQEDALVLEALVTLPPSFAHAGGALRVGLSAILEDEDTGLSYWALRHAPGRADFHHPHAFALTLEWT